jgi:hypothetical protein
MKKFIFGLSLIFAGVQFCFADRPNMFFAAICGSVGLETNFSLDEHKEGLWLLRVSFVDFFIQDERTGLGLSFIPIVVVGRQKENSNKYYADISPLNAEVFWSPLKIKNGMIFGPFANLNYFVNEKDLAFKTGLKFSLFSPAKESDNFDFTLNWLIGEFGYSRIDNTNNFFANIKIDILEFAYILLISQ